MRVRSSRSIFLAVKVSERIFDIRDIASEIPYGGHDLVEQVSLDRVLVAVYITLEHRDSAAVTVFCKADNGIDLILHISEGMLECQIDIL